MANLTKEQREHYEMLVETYGQPPEGTTHFDLNAYTRSVWTKMTAKLTCFWWHELTESWCEYTSRDYETSELISIPTEPVDTKFVCVELDSDEAVVGDLDTILYWQEERNIPAMRCIYYTVGEEVDFKDIVKQSRSE